MSSFSRFNAPLDLRYHSERRWEVLFPFQYDIDHLGSGISIDVPKGFITDMASVPKAFWGVISPFEERIAQCAVCHDVGCLTNRLMYLQDSGVKVPVKVSRQRIDEILEESLIVMKTTPWKINVIMSAVHLHRKIHKL